MTTVLANQHILKSHDSLRSKRFRRAFCPLEALFAFWLRKNWGERNPPRTFLRPLQFSRGQKSEKCIERAESLTETLATQASLMRDPALAKSLTNAKPVRSALCVSAF